MDTPPSLESIQALYEELGKKLCESHVELISARNDVEALQMMLTCGTSAVSLRAYREQLSLRKQGGMMMLLPDETMALLVEELEKKCDECKTLMEANEDLRTLVGAGFVEAMQMVAVMSSSLETEEIKMLRGRVRELEESMAKVKADYDWEHARRQEYAKELVLMRDMTFLKDLELRTILGMVTGTYSRDNDLTKWSRDQLISRLKTLEGVCGTMYKDEYIRDRNQRIGLAIVNIRDNSMALSQMEYRVKELSRLVRRFERLTEHACPEVERFVVDKLQERSEMLRGECELMEVRLAALNQKRADMETKCHEVSADFDTMRRDLQDSRRELGENQARCQRSKAEVDDLKKEIEEKKKAMSEIAAGAQQSAMLKSFDKMKLDAKREAEMADKSREITSATVREYEQTAAMLKSAKEELRACESEYERANAKLAAVKKDLRHATAELAEIKKKAA